MTDSTTNTVFQTAKTVITAAFMNHVNKLLHTIFDGSETKPEARAALDVYSKSESDANYTASPASTDEAVARFDGTAGNLQNSVVIIDDAGNIVVPGTVDGVDVGVDLTKNADTDVSANGWVLDEDDFSSNDATKVPTQQSVGAYVQGELTSALASNIDMAGAVLRGHSGALVTIAANTSLNNSTHQGADLIVTTNSTLTIDPQTTTAYNAGHQCVVLATHASGCTVTAGAGVALNGVTAGSATINQHKAYSLLRIGANDWAMPNAIVS